MQIVYINIKNCEDCKPLRITINVHLVCEYKSWAYNNQNAITFNIDTLYRTLKLVTYITICFAQTIQITATRKAMYTGRLGY